MKIRKVNKRKFVSRISIVIIFLILVFLSIKGLIKSSKDIDYDYKLIIDMVDVTEKLKNDIYLGKDSTLYMSTDDVKTFFDNNLFYEESTGKIITTCGTKVGAIDINANTMELNSASLLLSSGVLITENTIFLPISELKNMYNIDVITNKNSALILLLYKSLTTVNATKKISLKESESNLSKTIQKIEEGQELIYIEDSKNNGWIKVLTYEGNAGYVKEKDVGEKNKVRIDMQDSDFSSKEADINNSIELNNKTLTQDNLKDFSSRKKLIQDSISQILTKEKYTVNLNLKDVEISQEGLERFIIELIPRLKEIGANVIITNNTILENQFLEENNL